MSVPTEPPPPSRPPGRHSLEGCEVAVEVVAVYNLPGGGCRQVQDAVPYTDAVVLEVEEEEGGQRYGGGGGGGAVYPSSIAHRRVSSRTSGCSSLLSLRTHLAGCQHFPARDRGEVRRIYHLGNAEGTGGPSVKRGRSLYLYISGDCRGTRRRGRSPQTGNEPPPSGAHLSMCHERQLTPG